MKKTAISFLIIITTVFIATPAFAVSNSYGQLIYSSELYSSGSNSVQARLGNGFSGTLSTIKIKITPNSCFNYLGGVYERDSNYTAVYHEFPYTMKDPNGDTVGGGAEMTIAGDYTLEISDAHELDPSHYLQVFAGDCGDASRGITWKGSNTSINGGQTTSNGSTWSDFTIFYNINNYTEPTPTPTGGATSSLVLPNFAGAFVPMLNNFLSVSWELVLIAISIPLGFAIINEIKKLFNNKKK